MEKKKKKKLKPRAIKLVDNSKGLATIVKALAGAGEGKTTMNTTIAITYFFNSSSGKAVYQTLLYVDGSTSCDCPGWTKRCVAGQRTCKHVRLIMAGMADNECCRKVDHRGGGPVSVPAPSGTQPQLSFTGRRKFDFNL